MAADDRYTEIQGGELAEGRWFTTAELASGTPVAVIDQEVVHERCSAAIEPARQDDPRSAAGR